MSSIKNNSSNIAGIEVGYQVVGLQDLVVLPRTEKDKGQSTIQLGMDPRAQFKTSRRFWDSFCSRFHLSETVFNYYSHEEVFERISEVAGKKAEVRVSTEIDTTKGTRNLLALTKPDSPLIDFEHIQKLVRSRGSNNLIYSDGVLRSTFTPKSGELAQSIGGEEHERQFVLSTPVDGYGKPSIHLALLRQVCSNGLVAMSSAFQQDIKPGKEPWSVLDRALRTFTGEGEDGFKLLVERLEAAQSSNASIREVLDLRSLIARLMPSQRDVTERLEAVAGHLNNKYGVANINVLSEKKQRILPAECRVYDLINFATELATHRAEPGISLKLHGYVGSLVTGEYDLEGTATKQPKKFASRFLIAGGG